MLKDNTCYYVILGILSLRPSSGYDIKKTIENSIGYFYKVSNGQIYPVLKKLLDESAVIYTIEKNNGKPERKSYSITQRGHEVLLEWLESPGYKNDGELLLKIYFGSLEPAGKNIQRLNRMIESKEKNMVVYNRLAENFNRASRAYLPNIYSYFTLRFGQIMTQATIDWGKEVIGALQAIERDNPIE